MKVILGVWSEKRDSFVYTSGENLDSVALLLKHFLEDMCSVLNNGAVLKFSKKANMTSEIRVISIKYILCLPYHEGSHSICKKPKGFNYLVCCGSRSILYHNHISFTSHYLANRPVSDMKAKNYPHGQNQVNSITL